MRAVALWLVERLAGRRLAALATCLGLAAAPASAAKAGVAAAIAARLAPTMQLWRLVNGMMEPP